MATPGGDTPIEPTGTVELRARLTTAPTGRQWRHARPRRSYGATRCMSALLAATEQFVVSQSGIEFKAVYSGDSSTTPPRNPDPVAQTVDKSLTSTVVTSSPNSSGPLQAVTFEATVSAVAPGQVALSGTVTFADGGFASMHRISSRSFRSPHRARATCPSPPPNRLSPSTRVTPFSQRHRVRCSRTSGTATGCLAPTVVSSATGTLSSTVRCRRSVTRRRGSGGSHQLRPHQWVSLRPSEAKAIRLVASDGGIFSLRAMPCYSRIDRGDASQQADRRHGGYSRR